MKIDEKIVEGVVEEVKQRKNDDGSFSGYSIKIDGTWFSGFGEAGTQEGEEVNLEYAFGKLDKFGKPYKNIISLVKVKQKPGVLPLTNPASTTTWADTNQRIMRQAVLNTSSRIHSISLKEAELSVEEIKKSVVKMAEELEAWVIR